MKLSLRALFFLIAIAAVISLWLANRTTVRYPGALVQVVDPLPAQQNNSPTVKLDISNAFYESLLASLRKQHGEIVDQMVDPELEIREAIRLETMNKDDRTSLITIHAWGNPLTDDDEELKIMMKLAVDTLQSMSNNRPKGSVIKILNLPTL